MNLVSGETVEDNILTVSANVLGKSYGKLVTYIACVTYTDPDTALPISARTDISFAMVQTGANAKSCWVSGEQVFKYDTGGVVTPAQITLTANLQRVTVEKWWYKNGEGAWVEYPEAPDSSNAMGTQLNVKPEHDIWTDDMATVRVTTSDPDVHDIMTVYKVRDGKAGDSGMPSPVVFLSNNNMPNSIPLRFSISYQLPKAFAFNVC